MSYWTDIRLKIMKFWKKNRKIILVVLIVWTIIFSINQFLKSQKNKSTGPSTTYTPHVSVMDNTSEVPEKLQQPIVDILDQYFNYCNNGEYENAYNLLTDDCKKEVFSSLESFEAYIKNIFGQGGKIYNIQNYSNLEDTYIYNIRILDDILANGTTTGYGYYEEKITIIGDDKNNLKISISNFINNEEMNTFAEDDYMKIEITNKKVEYDSETYTVKITNKTEYPIVLANNLEDMEIAINIGDQFREIYMPFGNYVIYGNTTQTRDLTFTKFCDDGKTTSQLILNAIRVLESYSGNSENYEEEMNNAVKLYSLTIDL